ncbi:MAG: hypothetical protein MJ252_01900 [archaeon]|nr:hypothetical protein [archaeon]
MTILTNLIYLLNQGEQFTTQEKENLFFSVSKLLHSANFSLKRLIFLFVKHLNFWDNSFILTGSLISEINKNDDNLLKPNCFRLLGQIIDSSSVSVVERLLKVAISNQNADISCSAIICTYFMMLKGFNVAKSWISEITDKLTASFGQENLMTFHILLLLKAIKSSDKLFLVKIYLKIADSQYSKSQFALCQLIRYVSEMMRTEELESGVLNNFNAFLERSLYSLEESVKIEACRAILESTKTKAALQKNAISVICDLLSSPNKIVKFAALKTLNKYIASFSSTLAIDIFLEIEKIIEDVNVNSSIKAIALSIFLKISKGLSDFRLEKMFKTFIEQFPKFKDEFKKEVVIISRGISRENKQKNKLYYSFFCSLFKLDSNAQTKLELFEAILWFIYNDESLKTQALFFLAEFISDCQHDVVKIRILNLLGKECTLTANPGKLVRHIVNQINLETAMVRASAICALGQIAFKQQNQRSTIIKYIKKSFYDNDSEVRERAFFYYKALSELDGNKENEASNIKNSLYVFADEMKQMPLDIDIIQGILKTEKENLFKSNNISNEITNILKDPEKIGQILIKNKMNEKPKEQKGKTEATKEKSGPSIPGMADNDEYKKTKFAKIYGNPKVVTPFKKLTDQTAEYLTKYRKIVYDKAVIIDFEITNTIELQMINNVTIDIEDLESNGFDFSKTEIIEIQKLSTNETGHLYLKLSKNEDVDYSSCTFTILLKFDLQELDVKGKPHGIAVKEQYKIDQTVEINYFDYFTRNTKVDFQNFNDIWKMAEKSNYKKTEEKLGLPFKDIKSAARGISEIIGFNPLNDIEKIEANAKRYEFIYAYIGYLGNLLFIKFQLIFNDQNKCFAHIVILSQDEELGDLIMNRIYA